MDLNKSKLITISYWPEKRKMIEWKSDCTPFQHWIHSMDFSINARECDSLYGSLRSMWMYSRSLNFSSHTWTVKRKQKITTMNAFMSLFRDHAHLKRWVDATPQVLRTIWEIIGFVLLISTKRPVLRTHLHTITNYAMTLPRFYELLLAKCCKQIGYSQ